MQKEMSPHSLSLTYQGTEFNKLSILNLEAKVSFNKFSDEDQISLFNTLFLCEVFLNFGIMVSIFLWVALDY
jgi:hypothetical protein